MTTLTSLRTLPWLAASALLLSACPGDDTTGTGSSGSGDSGSGDGTTTMSTLPPPDMTTTTDTPMTTTGVDSSTSSPATDSTTTSAEDTTEGEEESSSGGDPMGSNYGDCANDEMACTANEQCLDGGTLAACGLQNCGSEAECEVPMTGDSVVSCDDVTMDGVTECFLDCSMGRACPDGMECAFDFICLWPAIAPGGGMCPDETIDGAMLPQALMGDMTGLFDDVIQSCGGGGGEDSLYEFTAPADATFIFDTAGSGIDTTLSVIDGCGGPELACNDDVGMELTSQLSLPMTMGQTAIVVVDSFDGMSGAFNLNVTQLVPGACPDTDLGMMVPQATMGDNTGLVDDHDASCAPDGDDAMFQFTAPMDGMYVFDTNGSVIDTVLSAIDGCGGMELDCNDDTAGTDSELTVDLTMGQSIILVVDGFGGDEGAFNLNISVL